MADIKQRLKDAMIGHPHAKIPWPHRLLHDACDRIEELESQLETEYERGRKKQRQIDADALYNARCRFASDTSLELVRGMILTQAIRDQEIN